MVPSLRLSRPLSQTLQPASARGQAYSPAPLPHYRARQHQHRLSHGMG
jgi:hypothetical protein